MKQKSERISSPYLTDILTAIDRVKEYVSDQDLESFKENKMIIDAVMRNLEVIGEAVSQLPEEVKTKHPEIPWRDIKDFRNIVAHRYWEINLDRIWDIVCNKLDELHEQISTILKQ